MDQVLESYYREGVLPENVDKGALCDHILSLTFPGMNPSNTVYLLDHGFVALKGVYPTPIGNYGCDYSIVEAARVSVGKGLGSEKGDKKLTSFLWDHKHMTPFEHAVFTFVIKCPIPIARHFQRHRTFSYNEESARYKNPEGEFYLPSFLRAQDTKNKQCSTDDCVPESLELLKEMEAHYESSWSLYKKMVEKGVAREQARLILPQSMYTTFIMTGNLRNWLHMISLRSAPDAQWEIQEYAKVIYKLLSSSTPFVKEILESSHTSSASTQ